MQIIKENIAVEEVLKIIDLVKENYQGDKRTYGKAEEALNAVYDLIVERSIEWSLKIKN